MFGGQWDFGPIRNKPQICHDLHVSVLTASYLIRGGPKRLFPLEQPAVSTTTASFLFRNRADALKAIREKTIDPGARRLLLDIVADYERVAEILLRIEQTQRVVAKRIPL
jgi:hypothetical protein